MGLGLPNQRSAIRAGRDFGTDLFAALLPPAPDPDLQTKENDVDEHHHNIAKFLVRDGEREIAAKRAGVDENFLFGPQQFLVRMLDPAIGNNSIGNQHHGKGIHRTEHCLAPAKRCTNRAPLAIGNDGERQGDGKPERKKEGLVDAWPFENVDCEEQRAVAFLELPYQKSGTCEAEH